MVIQSMKSLGMIAFEEYEGFHIKKHLSRT